MKKLEIQLGLNTIKHLEEKSHYNCNYYELEPYGDWCIFFNGNNIIEEICHEEDDFYTYSLGHFDGNEFVGVIQWDGEYGETIFDWRKGDDPCLHLKKQEEQDRHIVELEKENAELKNRNSELAGQKASLERWYGEAKELIGELISSLSVVGECEEEECELLNRAEQFLNSEVEV